MNNHQHLADRRPQFITVFCAASHCPKTLAGGWAVWMKDGVPAITQRLSGALFSVKDSHFAEIVALEKALDYIETNLDVTNQIVVIESDCQGAMKSIEKSAEALKMRGAKHVKLKWVKGHQGVKCARSSVNTWCDKEAKRHMRLTRDRIIRQSNSCSTIYGPSEVAS